MRGWVASAVAAFALAACGEGTTPAADSVTVATTPVAAPTPETTRETIFPRPGDVLDGTGPIGDVTLPSVAPEPVTLAYPAMTGASVYEPSTPLPDGAPGTVIWGEPIAPDVVPDSESARILFRSTSLDGAGIAVSAIVVAPDTPPVAGPVPIVVWAHGTTGLADSCAPSLDPYHPYTLPYIDSLVASGYTVVAPDYEGLGTPGPHTYLVGPAEARAVLDAARAAVQVDVRTAGAPVLVYGHSQGGQAALFAGQEAAAYAPDVPLAGIAASAPANELESIFSYAGSYRPWAAYFVMTMAGFGAAYPDELRLDDVFTDTVMDALPVLEQTCVEEAQAFFATVAQPLVDVNPFDVAGWHERVMESVPGGAPASVPVLVVEGELDELVPPEAVARVVASMCALGSTVQYETYAGATHYTVLTPAAGDILSFFGARVSGQAPTNDCA